MLQFKKILSDLLRRLFMLKNVRQDCMDQTAQSNAPTVLMEWTVNKNVVVGMKTVIMCLVALKVGLHY